MWWLFLYAVLDGYNTNKKPKTKIERFFDGIVEWVIFAIIVAILVSPFYALYKIVEAIMS